MKLSQGLSLTLVRGHSDFKVKCLTFGLYTQVSDSGPDGPLVFFLDTLVLMGDAERPCYTSFWDLSVCCIMALQCTFG